MCEFQSVGSTGLSRSHPCSVTATTRTTRAHGIRSRTSQGPTSRVNHAAEGCIPLRRVLYTFSTFSEPISLLVQILAHTQPDTARTIISSQPQLPQLILKQLFELDLVDTDLLLVHRAWHFAQQNADAPRVDDASNFRAGSSWSTACSCTSSARAGSCCFRARTADVYRVCPGTRSAAIRLSSSPCVRAVPCPGGVCTHGRPCTCTCAGCSADDIARGARSDDGRAAPGDSSRCPDDAG